MFKVIVLSILALGAVLSIPSVRTRVAPVFAPITKKLEPVTARITAPAKKWKAKNEARDLLHKLSDEDAQKIELPSPLSFQVWVRTRTTGERRGKDPWDRPYYLLHENRQLTVGSAGPDRKRNTRDDVRVSAPIR